MHKKEMQGRKITSLFRRRCSTSDNFNQLSSNDSLSSSVEKDLEPVDHVTGVLGGIVHGVTTGRDLAGVAFSEGLFHRR